MEKDYSVLFNYVDSNANRGCRVTCRELVVYCIGLYGSVNRDLFDQILEMYFDGLIDA